jgi:hypothetical protein
MPWVPAERKIKNNNFIIIMNNDGKKILRIGNKYKLVSFIASILFSARNR